MENEVDRTGFMLDGEADAPFHLIRPEVFEVDIKRQARREVADRQGAGDPRAVAPRRRRAAPLRPAAR